MGLLTEIQNEAVSDTGSAAALLRKCMVLAANLDSALLEDWVKWELNGYPAGVEVPEYRQMRMNFKVSGNNLAYQINGAPIASVMVKKVTKNDKIDIFVCRQPIGTIRLDDIKASDGTLVINLDNYALLLPGKVTDRDFNVQRFWGEIPASQVLGVVDAVKNRVLEFVLALRKQYPDAGEVDGMTTKSPEVEQAVNHIYNTTINGNAGVVGQANHSTVNIIVNAGSVADLRSGLMKHGIEEADILDLEAAVTEEPTIGTDKKFGPKVTQWVGKMVAKAGSGAWAVSLGAAGALLEKALLGYYGYN